MTETDDRRRPAAALRQIYDIGKGMHRPASYSLALPLVTTGAGDFFKPAKLRRQSAGGITKVSEVLEKVGLHWKNGTASFNPSPNGESHRKALNQNFREFSDTFLTLAAIAPLLDGPTNISGIAHTRKQETDRVAGMARELTKLGQHVIETEDSLKINPRPLLSGVEIETYHDHRFAMSFGILGCHDLNGNGQPWLTINWMNCLRCSKTYPPLPSLTNSESASR